MVESETLLHSCSKTRNFRLKCFCEKCSNRGNTRTGIPEQKCNFVSRWNEIIYKEIKASVCLRPHGRSENFYGGPNQFEVMYVYAGTKGDWDFLISDLVKNHDGTDI